MSDMKNVLGLLVIAALVLSCRVNGSPGDGEKIGQIVKLSKVGIFCDTWEGQLIRGGMNGGSGSFGTVPFDFTITDVALAEQARGYMQKQTEVLIQYRVEGVYSVCRSGSDGHFDPAAVSRKTITGTSRLRGSTRTITCTTSFNHGGCHE